MGKPPAFQLYAGDFLSDENVILMNNREVGCYIKLLCFNWKQESIPNDIDKLAKLCGESSEDMVILWENIKPCFKEKTPGRLVNPRIERERVKQKRFSENRRKAGKLGAEKRWKNEELDGKAITQPMANDSFSSSSSSSSSSSDILLEEKKRRSEERKKEKESKAENIYYKYIETINPMRKTKKRTKNNLVKLFKEYSPEDLSKSIDNYLTTSRENTPKYRMDPANFFGKDEPFEQYLPINFKMVEDLEDDVEGRMVDVEELDRLNNGAI